MHARRSVCLARWLGVGLILLAGACETRRWEIPPELVGPLDGPVGGGGGSGTDVPIFMPVPDASPGTDGPESEGGTGPDACTPGTCVVAGGQFCGRIGDGCGGALECGDCPTGQLCGGNGMPHVCSPPPGTPCTPLTCDQATGRLCGRIGDGCGRLLDCGDCTGGMACGAGGTPNVCAKAPGTCTPLTCDQAGGRYCGKIGDGCGRPLDCGDCPTGQTCGGDGTPGVCGSGSGMCTALTCAPTGGRFCGNIGDGCGHALDCGTCPSGQTCGGNGKTNVCAGMLGGCTPLTCDQPNGRFCGVVGNGCGLPLDCGACPAGQVCGAKTLRRLRPRPRIVHAADLPDRQRAVLRQHRRRLRRHPGLRGLPHRPDLRRRRHRQRLRRARGHLHRHHLHPDRRPLLRRHRRRLRQGAGLRRLPERPDLQRRRLWTARRLHRAHLHPGRRPLLRQRRRRLRRHPGLRRLPERPDLQRRRLHPPGRVARR